MKINADNVTPIDAVVIPSGEIVPVKNTPMDFTLPTVIGARINNEDKQLEYGKGYDHNWVINNSGDSITFACSAYDPSTGRMLTEDPLWLIMLGPATDAAIALKKDPKITDRIIIFWHGRTPKWAGALPEFQCF